MNATRVVYKSNRANSFRSSCSASSEPILEDVQGETANHGIISSGDFDRQSQPPRMATRNDTEDEISAEANASDETQIISSRRQQPGEAEIVRTRIKYHFMNPYQKYKARGRKPWKLLIQIFKIIIVTTQVALFGFDRFDVVNFLEDNTEAFQHLFIKGYNHTSISIYTKDDVYSYLHYANSQYYQVKKEAIGSYDYVQVATDGSVPPVKLCYAHFKKGEINPSNNTYDVNPDVKQVCFWLVDVPEGNKHEMDNVTFSFGSLLYINLQFSLRSMNIKRLKMYDKPTCHQFDIELNFDNTRHDGRMPLDLRTTSKFLHHCKGHIKDSDDVSGTYVKYFLVAFDVIVITVCLVSCALTVRSLVRSFWLAKDVAKFFKERRQEKLTLSELIVFINFWFVLIVISDLLTIVGSFYKVLIDQKDSDYYNDCSIFLGIAVLLVWAGLLRFLGYLKEYNILLLTLKAAAPSVFRFMICATVLFVGYLFCGWIVLGPYHHKFKNLTVTAECMYSLLNGDDMFATFKEMKATSIGPWIFSKLYLYSFISLFIYVVLSLFIGIICDTYERLKDMGNVAQTTRIVSFLNETPDDEVPSQRSRKSGRPRQLWRAVSTLTGNSIMRRVSLDSTGAE